MKPAFLLIFTLCCLQLSAQDYAIAQLENSPRHHEWIELTSNNRTLHCFVAYPERSDNAPVVSVIHENRGLNDWARSMTDQLAGAGYIAIAPDLLSGANEAFEKTSDYPTSDQARTAIYGLKPDQVTNDLNAVYEYGRKLEAGNGQFYVMGFCWGGSQTFRYATNNTNIEAAMVFYGTAPKDGAGFERIKSPVYGFYGGADQRVNATIAETASGMKKQGKTYDYVVYENAGHAFMRRGDDPNGDSANVTARNEAWKRLKKIIAEN